MVSSQRPRFAVLDEPTAGMTKDERTEFAEMILSHRGTVTYLVVEHDMEFVKTVADRVSFMHEGQVTADRHFRGDRGSSDHATRSSWGRPSALTATLDRSICRDAGARRDAGRRSQRKPPGHPCA